MDRQAMIDRIDALTGVYTDWALLPTEGLQGLLDHLESVERQIGILEDTIESFKEIEDQRD